MKKKLLAAVIVILFIGMSTFACATNNVIENETQNNKPSSTNKYVYAKIELIDGELEVIGGACWFSFPVGREKWFMLLGPAEFKVNNGSLAVKPIFGKEITLYPEDTIYLNVAFVIYNEDINTDGPTLFKGTAFGVKVEQL